MGQVQIGINDVFGYAIGVISLIVAIIIYYRSKIDLEKLKSDLTREHQTNESYRERIERIFSSINDISFSTLLRVKNVPADKDGMVLQHEALMSSLISIQKIAQRGVENTIFQGEYVFGSELGSLEDNPHCLETWLISQDLRPDVEEHDLLKSVAKNISAGKSYHYVVPSDIPAHLKVQLMSRLKSELLPSTQHLLDQNVFINEISRLQFHGLFSNGAIALYVMRPSDRRNPMASLIIGFDEVVLPNERRGSLWQRQPEDRAKALINTIRSAVKEAAYIGQDAGSLSQNEIRTIT
jgi:hypothetical protein